MEPFESNTGQPTKFSPLELECIDIVEGSPDSSDLDIEHERREQERKLWNNFQNSALAVAQLYRDVPAVNPTLNQQHHWTSFQNASTNIALLYKDCSDFQKKMSDFHNQSGYSKRNKELLTWAKMKKNYIRRDELLAFISGRPYTPTGHGVSGIFKTNRSSRASSRSNARFFPVDTVADSARQNPNDETNLQAFREALYHANYRNSSNIFTSNNNNSSNNNNINNNNNNRRSSRSNEEDLNEFISQEYFRHVESRKRSTNMDVNMDSPNNKRTKFC